MTDQQIERMKELAYKAYPDVKDKSGEYWYNNSPSRTVFMDGACAAYNNLTADYAWAIYNFINEYKAGNFGALTLQEALDNDFKY